MTDYQKKVIEEYIKNSGYASKVLEVLEQLNKAVEQVESNNKHR